VVEWLGFGNPGPGITRNPKKPRLSKAKKSGEAALTARLHLLHKTLHLPELRK
jgi:hypothetical protein